MTFLVGLSGGIGSGKSTVARIFSDLGVPTLDADDVARLVVAPDQPALRAIAERFGNGVIARDGSLDRKSMRQAVFSDEQARRDLEAILHPAIRRYMTHWVREQHATYCLWVVPLLFETGMNRLTNQTVVVDLPRSLQRDRVLTRDGDNAAQVDRIMSAQWDRDRRLAAADHVIDNSGSVHDLNSQVSTLHGALVKLAERAEKP
ncbi:MAG: dephospho-CoA kinase [Gammaproteobacteria bacterium]